MHFLICLMRLATTTESPLDSDELDELQTAVDAMLLEDEEEEPDFLLILRLSPVPEYLVKGYDFEMLNKY